MLLNPISKETEIPSNIKKLKDPYQMLLEFAKDMESHEYCLEEVFTMGLNTKAKLQNFYANNVEPPVEFDDIK